MLKNLRILICVCVFTSFLIFMQINATVAKELQEDMLQNRAKVHITNFINILDLTREQLESLHKQSITAKSIHQDYLRKREKESEKLQKTQLKLTKELDTTKQKISESTSKNIEHSNNKINKLFSYRKKKMAKVTDYVMDTLDKKQINIIDAYKPLTILPVTPSLNDKTNISGIIQVLEHARRMPEGTYSGRRFMIAHGLVDKLSSQNPSSMKADRNIAMDKVIKTIDKALSLDRDTFNQQKEEMAIAIKNDIIGQQQPISINEKIEIFLLNPSTIPILEERLNKSQDS